MPVSERCKEDLPEGSYDLVELKDLTDEEADYIATWLSKAFAVSDISAYRFIGHLYSEDPESHRLFWRAHLDRGLVTGTLVTNKPRTAIRMFFEPGQAKAWSNMDWETPKDDNWNALLARIGGKEVAASRIRENTEMRDQVRKDLYGEDAGLHHYRSDLAAVHPDFQGKGLGSLIHRYIAERAKSDGKQWWFSCVGPNVSFYEGLGCKVVSPRLPTCVSSEALKGFKSGNEFSFFLEAIPPFSV